MLLYWLLTGQIKENKIEEVNKVGMKFWQKMPHQLSGGEQQLARALLKSRINPC
jgi:ABC-type proline/glycine betaine transport system ATPase subunit